MLAPAYAPILRWKQAERLSLRDIDSSDADVMLPLVEVVPKFITDGNLTKLPKQMENSWPGRRLLLDGAPPEFRESDQAVLVFGEVARSVGELSVEVVPVMSPRDNRSTVDAAMELSTQYGYGGCIRARADDLHLVPEFVSGLSMRHHDIDLVVDFGVVGGQAASRYRSALGSLPSPDLWRNVIFAGGAFPPDLTGFSVGQHVIPRHDLIAWQSVAAEATTRRPVYGDYTIQNPAYSEPVTFSNFSASIRYATPHDWVIMRGEGVRNPGGAGYDQWPANAMLLRERPEFCGPAFSAGDRYVEQMGTAPTSTGNAASWLRAGINHHMTLACRQSANRI